MILENENWEGAQCGFRGRTETSEESPGVNAGETGSGRRIGVCERAQLGVLIDFRGKAAFKRGGASNAGRQDRRI